MSAKRFPIVPVGARAKADFEHSLSGCWRQPLQDPSTESRVFDGHRPAHEPAAGARGLALALAGLSQSSSSSSPCVPRSAAEGDAWPPIPT